jgi:hypothetical protein
MMAPNCYFKSHNVKMWRRDTAALDVVKVVIWSFGHLVIFDFGWSFLLTIIINIYIYIIVSDFDN